MMLSTMLVCTVIINRLNNSFSVCVHYDVHWTVKLGKDEYY